ncbi:hypothetical protein I79_006989 [Cricetulus griseus]|uniref:Uncharacterized protein n=1 Tax=Cricetulus griseus TaxID=10029 RepID=G3H9C2_CRIGR|nr:hypothetical protein I79_006989 [Cricetulus griseus]
MGIGGVGGAGSTQEAEADRSLRVQSQSGLKSEFQDSQNCYNKKLCVKETKQKTNKEDR